ncbi:VOC family protein [Brevibacillus sp. NRS-1366]|uniref:VOC family protein n=1 Tax=Brevibacillus sp. NRS-1366 TaxID=3233899 RepID=UPI003D1D7EB3
MTPHIHDETKIGQVTLKVSSLARSLRFYREVIGFQVLREENSTAELTVDGIHPLVLLEEVTDAMIPERRTVAGLYHFAILLPNRKSLGLSLRQLIASGIHIGHSDHLVSEALYISDPDHNGIEIYADRPRDTWKRDENGEYIMTLDPIDWDGLLEEAKDEVWKGLPIGTTIGHIHLHVSDLAKTKEFYTGVLGFEQTAHMSDSALFVSAGGYHHHIGLNTWAGIGAKMPPPRSTGLDYFTIVVPNEPQLHAVYTRLQEAQHPVSQEEETLFFNDPSGISIRVQVAK